MMWESYLGTGMGTGTVDAAEIMAAEIYSYISCSQKRPHSNRLNLFSGAGDGKNNATGAGTRCEKSVVLRLCYR